MFVHLYVCPSVCLSICMFIWLSWTIFALYKYSDTATEFMIYSILIPLYTPLHLSVCLHQPLCLFVCPSFIVQYLSVCLSVHLLSILHYLALELCLSVCLSVCLSLLSVCPFVVHPSLCSIRSLSVCLSVCLSVSAVCLSLLSVCPFVCPSFIM